MAVDGWAVTFGTVMKGLCWPSAVRASWQTLVSYDPVRL